MSKSKGNFFTVRDILKDYDGEVIRFFLLSGHYRNPINFSDTLMEQAKAGLARMQHAKENLKHLIATGEGTMTDEEKKELESSVQIEKQELSDYYSMWVHQIKTPIAALGVLIQSGEELEEVQESPKAQELTRSMKMEVFRIEQYVDMVLTYLRMGSATSDYTFRICSLEEIVRQAVRKYSQMFIMTRTRLHLEIQNQKILTDEKWLTFVIEQILSNAVKYARGGEISIYTEEKTLVISDNGIGIAEEDLPRIFEKGFTGYNGRANKKSTGIGLYLCKTIIDRLHHTIWIESKPEKGTKVYLNFDRAHRRIE